MSDTALRFAMAMSLVLIWSLIRRKLRCRICWAGHVANAAIWIWLLVRVLRFA